jgi:hypothetical protein
MAGAALHELRKETEDCHVTELSLCRLLFQTRKALSATALEIVFGATHKTRLIKSGTRALN